MTVPPHASGDRDQLRTTYLNDHLAGAAGGVALAGRLEKLGLHIRRTTRLGLAERSAPG